MQVLTSAQRKERIALMEQSLLADRFALRVHFQPVEMPIYALELSKGAPGAAMKPASGDETTRIAVAGTRLTATAVMMSEFAQAPQITGVAGRIVADRTGLTGRYDFTLDWTNDGSESAGLISALRDQLGLRLVATKAMVETMVIDQAERPSVN